MAQLFFMPSFSEGNANDVSFSGAKLEFFETGTSTQLDTYTDDGLTTAHTNPVIADSTGRWAPIYLKAQDYKVTLSTSDDVQIWSADPVHGQSNVNRDALVNYVPFEHYGGVEGDDESNAATNDTAMVAAQADAKGIWFRPGTWYFTEITLAAGKALVGAETNTTIFKMNATSGNDAITIDNFNYDYNNIIKNLTIQAGASNTQSTDDAMITARGEVHFEGVAVLDFANNSVSDVGLKLLDCGNSTFIHCWFQGNKYGVWEPPASTFSDEIAFLNCTTEDGSSHTTGWLFEGTGAGHQRISLINCTASTGNKASVTGFKFTTMDGGLMLNCKAKSFAATSTELEVGANVTSSRFHLADWTRDTITITSTQAGSDGVLLAMGGEEFSQQARATTTDATETTLAEYDVDAERTTSLEGTVIVHEDATNDAAAFFIQGFAHNNGGTTALIGTPTVTKMRGGGSATWDVAVDADDTNDRIRIRVTGEASHTLRWRSHVKTFRHPIVSGVSDP